MKIETRFNKSTCQKELLEMRAKVDGLFGMTRQQLEGEYQIISLGNGLEGEMSRELLIRAIAMEYMAYAFQVLGLE